MDNGRKSRKNNRKLYKSSSKGGEKEISEKYIVAIFLIMYLISYFVFFSPKNLNLPISITLEDVTYTADYGECSPEVLTAAGFDPQAIAEYYTNKSAHEYCKQHINFTISKDGTWNSIIEDSGYDWQKLIENPTDDGYAIMAALAFLTAQDSNSDFDGLFTQRMLDSVNRNFPEEIISLDLKPVGNEMTRENLLAITHNLRVLNEYDSSKLELSIYRKNANRIDFLEEYFKALKFENGCINVHCKDDLDSSGVSLFIANSFSQLTIKQNRTYAKMGQIVKIEDFGKYFIKVRNIGRENIASDSMDLFIDMGIEHDVNYISCNWKPSILSPNQTASCRFKEINNICKTMAVSALGNRHVINCSSLG